MVRAGSAGLLSRLATCRRARRGLPAGPGGRERNERGSTLVEFALILPLILFLVFGIIEFGTVYSSQISVRQGVREGARQGAVANWGTTSSCSLHGTTGASADIQNLMCLTKNRIGLASSNLYVMVAFDSSYAVGQGLIVCAQSPIKSYTGFFAPILNGKFYKSKVEMNIEQAPNSETGGAEDVSGISSDWSWCTASNPSP
jgi:hypothetical protein